MKTVILPAAAALLFAAAGTATAQSNPADFGTVYNIGTVSPGSIFDVPEATTFTQIGDGNSSAGQALITPTFPFGDTLGSDSQLNILDEGVVLGGFTAGPLDGTGSNIEVNVAGGSVGVSFNAFTGSTVNISGGTVGDFFEVFTGSTVNITGGAIGNTFEAFSGSEVNISGGSVGDGFNASSGSIVNISGGSVGAGFDAFGGSTVNISGGSVGDEFSAFGGAVNLFGTSFLLDGVELSGLDFGEAFTITDRNVSLTGLLADGSAFDFDLNTPPAAGQDFFDVSTTLTVTLVPSPGGASVLALGGILASRRRR